VEDPNFGVKESPRLHEDDAHHEPAARDQIRKALVGVARERRGAQLRFGEEQVGGSFNDRCGIGNRLPDRGLICRGDHRACHQTHLAFLQVDEWCESGRQVP
jgi:hypothetical protein